MKTEVHMLVGVHQVAKSGYAGGHACPVIVPLHKSPDATAGVGVDSHGTAGIVGILMQAVPALERNMEMRVDSLVM
jgi:hypothetical protein